MRTGVGFHLDLKDRQRLEAVVASRNSPQKHVWRALIVLLSADGSGTMEIQCRTGKAKPTIWRWQKRFMKAGVRGLLCDATRPGRKLPLTSATIEQTLAMTGVFAKLTSKRLKRSSFGRIAELQAAIDRFLRELNERPRPFVWTADPDCIIEKVTRGRQALAAQR